MAVLFQCMTKFTTNKKKKKKKKKNHRMKEKTNLEYIGSKNSYFLKDTIKNIKMKFTNWKNICKHKYAKGLLSRLNK